MSHIDYNDLVEHLEDKEIKNLGVRILVTECPNCGHTARRTVRPNGIDETHHYCRNYERCSTDGYRILGNITGIYEKKEVKQ